MDRMLVVVFDNEVKAYEGRKALLQLDNEGSISVYAYAVLAKRADGTASVKQGDDSGPIGTLFGTSFGSLIGLLGGPVGFAPVKALKPFSNEILLQPFFRKPDRASRDIRSWLIPERQRVPSFRGLP